MTEDLKKRAQIGDPAALFQLGYNYKFGVGGVSQDFKEAVRLYTLAAQQGLAGAQINLGVCYEKGQGVTKDLKEAVRLHTLAAQQGKASAQYNLGVYYEKGQGVTKNLKEAVRFYTLAAQQGDTEAQ